MNQLVLQFLALASPGNHVFDILGRDISLSFADRPSEDDIVEVDLRPVRDGIQLD